MDFRRFKEYFDQLFLDYLRRRIERSLGGAPHLGVQELLLHLLAVARGGKRLRPYLAYVGFGSFSDELSPELLRLCIGVELFHTFAIVHDDIIDKDTERRGVPSMHAHAAREDRSDHLANSLAMLAGDLLLAWSKECLDNELIRGYAERMIDEVHIGETIELLLPLSSAVSMDELDQMIEMKTSRYSFVRPLQMGAALRGMDNTEESFYLSFGLALGRAFQIQDDSFDQDRDRERGVPTYFTSTNERVALSRMNDDFKEALVLAERAPARGQIREALLGFSRLIQARTE